MTDHLATASVTSHLTGQPSRAIVTARGHHFVVDPPASLDGPNEEINSCCATSYRGWQRVTEFTAEAFARVDAFIAEHPEYARQEVEQPAQGATNRVIFARRGDSLVVFKVFCEAERKQRECFGLRHWQETGHVPELIWDVDPDMIVMSHVPGAHLHMARKREGEVVWRQSCYETGKAVAALTQVPLDETSRAAFESRFYGELGTLEAYLERIVDLGQRVHARDPDFHSRFWGESLEFVGSQLDRILGQPRLLYHQDVGNLHVWQGRFMGFHDLEMCRVGCTSMQLGAALGPLVDSGKAGWEPFRAGWEAETGTPLDGDNVRAAAAVQHLLSCAGARSAATSAMTARRARAMPGPARPIPSGTARTSRR
jgi:hypothetical protein